MNDEELFKSLKQIRYVFSYNYNLLKKVFEIVNKSNIVDLYTRTNYIDINKFDSWSTYDECVDFKFETKDNKVLCEVSVYDGNLYDGERERLRFKLVVIVPHSFLKNIENLIQEELESYFSRKYRKMLQQMEIDWVNNQIREFLEDMD